ACVATDISRSEAVAEFVQEHAAKENDDGEQKDVAPPHELKLRQHDLPQEQAEGDDEKKEVNSNLNAERPEHRDRPGHRIAHRTELTSRRERVVGGQLLIYHRQGGVAIQETVISNQ